MNHLKYCFVALAIIGIANGVAPKRVDLTPFVNMRGDEIINQMPVPYLGGRQSPGIQIGITTYDFQANGSFGHRCKMDDNRNIHVDWMWCGGPYPGTRYCAWNFRFTDGTWYGETQGSPSVSGYVQLDVVRDANPDNQVSAIAYHYDPGAGYFGWVDTDAGQGWGLWPNNMVTPAVNNHIWPRLAWTENGNIIMPTGDYDADIHHLYVSTDLGSSWTHVNQWDSCGTLSTFGRASHNSNKIVFVHTQYITDQPNVQLDNDVYYMLSVDGGVTWGPHTNITNYQTADTVRAYCNVNAVFDQNDNLHIAWAGRRCTYPDMWEASKIFHWDEVSNTITIVNSPSTYYVEPGGWWIATETSPQPGSWRMPADQPQLVVDETTGWLYCLWHGNDDYNDGSAAGYFNGEFYGSRSTDGGLTWIPYVNLTNTRSPGAPPGSCYDEDYMTANPVVVNDSIFLAYIEDKDAGSMPHTEGVMTTNPVRCWIFHKDLISPGVSEYLSERPQSADFDLFPNPASNYSAVSYSIAQSCYVTIGLYDGAGRLIRDLDGGYRKSGVYNAKITTDKLANGTYFVVLETSDQKITHSLTVVH